MHSKQFKAKLDLVKNPLQKVIYECIKKFPWKNFSQKNFLHTYWNTAGYPIRKYQKGKGKDNQK